MSSLQSMGIVWGLAVAGAAQASPHSTKWTVRNESRDTVMISCRNLSVTTIDITLPEQRLAAGSTFVYDWGDRYHNDGLWLNPGKWTCALQSSNKAVHTARNESFSTDWGEAITLVLSRFDNQLRLRKIPLNTPVATKDDADARSKGAK